MTYTRDGTDRCRGRARLVVSGLVLLLALVLSGCGRPQGTRTAETGQAVTITAREYAFDAPTTLPAGRTTLAFTNAGKEEHELVLMRLAEGATLEQALAADEAGEDVDKLIEEFTAAVGAKPGKPASASITADLAPGKYALVCFISADENSPPHYTKGMRKTITVS